MKKIIVLAGILAFCTSACMPALPFLPQPEDSAPAADVQATDESLAATLAVETLNALPSPSPEPASDTPPASPVLLQSPTVTATPTTDPNATIAMTGTGTGTPDPNATLPTGTAPTATSTATGTLLPGISSATETLHARFFGTQPPSVPSGQVRLVNRAKVEVYVSLQCTTIDGYNSILEYPVTGTVKVSAPAGKYLYVAWVGGRQFLGNFNLDKGGDVKLIIKKDKVNVQ